MKTNRLIYPSILILSLAACDSNNDPHNHPQLKSGKQLFDFHCASCHSKDGHGQFLKAVPSNRTTELSTQQIITRIRTNSGDKERRMPVFPSMGSHEARKIASYLLKLKKEYSSQDR